MFLDTMLYLHFVPLEQIDFCGILGLDLVKIMVPRVTLRELEKHKTSHGSARTRDRARQALAFIEKHIESGLAVRDGVFLEFIPHAPRLDMERHGLNPLWNDDVLIASVLEYKARNESGETLLVTHDTGARLTCRHLGVRTFQLPDKYSLPAEPDENEKETQRVRRDLQKLQNALPRLVIGFADEMESVGHFSLSAPETVDESQIAQKLSELRREFPEVSQKQNLPSPLNDQVLAGFAKILAQTDVLNSIPDEEFQRFNKERLAYFEKSERYMRAETETRNRIARTIRFRVLLSNTGSAPADDVDVRLLFPDGFSLCGEDDVPRASKEPKRPTKPRTKMETMMTTNFSMMRIFVFRK